MFVADDEILGALQGKLDRALADRELADSNAKRYTDAIAALTGDREGFTEGRTVPATTVADAPVTAGGRSAVADPAAKPVRRPPKKAADAPAPTGRGKYQRVKDRHCECGAGPFAAQGLASHKKTCTGAASPPAPASPPPAPEAPEPVSDVPTAPTAGTSTMLAGRHFECNECDDVTFPHLRALIDHTNKRHQRQPHSDERMSVADQP